MTTTVRLLATSDGNPPQTIVRLPDALAASFVAAGNASLNLTGGINLPPPPVARVVGGGARLIYSAAGTLLGIGDSNGNLILNSSGATTPVGATVPGAPTSLALTAAAGAVIGAFTAPASTGGDSIQWYEMTLSNGTVVRGDASPIAAAAPAGAAVTAVVRAVNGVGPSPASNTSNSVTPTGVAPTVPATAITLTGPTTVVQNVATTNYTVALSPVGGTVASPVTVTPTAVAGVTFAPTSVQLTTASPSATFTATSTTTGTKSIAVTNNGGLTNPAAISLVVSAAASGGTLRQVATNTHIYSAQHASNKQANTRSPHYMRGDSPTLQIVLPNWWVGATEVNGTGADTWRAALEYPEGVFTQILFGGAASGVAAVGANLISDAVTAPPQGAKFWIRLNLSSAGLIKFQGFYQGDGTAQAEFAVSGLTDKTMGGSIAAVASKDAGMILPCAIIGVSTVRAVGIYGDSISVGRGDTDGVGRALQGHLGRSFGAVAACGHVGISGDRLANWVTSNTKRSALATYFTDIAGNMGINDVSNSASAATIQTQTNTMISALNGGGTRRVAFCTLGPVSTSTDLWVTVENQTAAVATPNAVRSAVNTQRLTDFPLANVIYDVNPTVENITTPEDSLWKITGGANTDDGTHHNPNSASRIAAAINTSLLLV